MLIKLLNSSCASKVLIKRKDLHLWHGSFPRLSRAWSQKLLGKEPLPHSFPLWLWSVHTPHVLLGFDCTALRQRCRGCFKMHYGVCRALIRTCKGSETANAPVKQQGYMSAPLMYTALHRFKTKWNVQIFMHIFLVHFWLSLKKKKKRFVFV